MVISWCFFKNNIDKIYIFKGERKYNYGLITGREISYFGYRRNNKNEQRLCFNNSINARNQLYCYAINLWSNRKRMNMGVYYIKKRKINLNIFINNNV